MANKTVQLKEGDNNIFPFGYSPGIQPTDRTSLDGVFNTLPALNDTSLMWWYDYESAAYNPYANNWVYFFIAGKVQNYSFMICIAVMQKEIWLVESQTKTWTKIATPIT